MANNYVSLTYDDTGLVGAIDKIVATATDAVRPAAQAGAQVLYDDAKRNVPASTEAHIFQGSSYKGKKKKNGKKSKGSGQQYLFYPGNLKDSIYQAFSQDNSGPLVSTYHVAWNHKKAPYGFMVEFGTLRTNRIFQDTNGRWYTTNVKLKVPKKRAGKAFLRGAWEAEGQHAIAAMREVYGEKMKEVMP